MDKILSMSDTINVGRNKKVLVSDLVGVKGEIFNLIKKGLRFDDEVLKEAHITKTIRDVRINNCDIEHKPIKNKEYTKETESLKNILKSINTIDKIQESENYVENENQEVISTENTPLEEEE
jgi:hypothetical protein